MASLVYSMSVSLDGFVETRGHSLEWVIVDEELHRHFNEEARGQAAFLYGRGLYETMAPYWPTADEDAALPATSASSRGSGGRRRRSCSRRAWTMSAGTAGSSAGLPASRSRA